jgi:hypothetical protein
VDVGGATTNAPASRTAKSCGPDTSTLVSSWRSDPRDDGGKKARSPRRSRRKPLKPLRAGMPGDPATTVVTTLVCFNFFAREAAGAAGARHSPRPCFRADVLGSNSGVSRREVAVVCLHLIASQTVGANGSRKGSHERQAQHGPQKQSIYFAATPLIIGNNFNSLRGDRR